MNYTDWDSFLITLTQNGIEINKNLTMRTDIEKMDSLSVKNLLIDVLSCMTSDTLKSGVLTYLPPNCNDWDEVSLSLYLGNTTFKNVTLNRSLFTSNLLDSKDFFYNEFIQLSELVLIELQVSTTTTQNNNQQTGINGTFMTVDGLTITVQDGLIISIN